MAFFSKAGGLLRQTVSNKHISQQISASSPSIFQMIRCMSTAKVFIGGLSYNTNDDSLREAFEKYGAVDEARVILDRETGRSRGFGFVTYTTPEEASSAIQALDGQDLHGRVVKVNYANERARSPGYGGGDGAYGGGGYGGGGGGYGNGGYGGGGSYGSAGGGGYGGGNSYGSGGSYGGGDSYGSGGGNYGGGYETGGSTGARSNVSYGNDAQNFGVAGGGENNTGFGTTGGNDFAGSSGDAGAN